MFFITIRADKATIMDTTANTKYYNHFAFGLNMSRTTASSQLDTIASSAAVLPDHQLVI